MESPPSYSNSEAPVLSEDSGLFIRSGSFSSDSASGWHQITSELQESDYDDRSLSLCESTETSERMCGDNFNTVKKGPIKITPSTIEPPPQFQDSPTHKKYTDSVIIQRDITTFNKNKNFKVGPMTLDISLSKTSPKIKKPEESLYDRRPCFGHRFSPRLLRISPCRNNRPASRSSLTSRLSSSHNSLINQLQADDSSFITQAISHDALSSKTSDIPDMYNVPFDSDVYAVPIDMIRPNRNNVKHKSKKFLKSNKKRNKSILQTLKVNVTQDKNVTLKNCSNTSSKQTTSKRHSLPGSSVRNCTESDSEIFHVTLHEMRNYLHALYSSSSDIESRHKNVAGNYNNALRDDDKEMNTRLFVSENSDENRNIENNNNHKKSDIEILSPNNKTKKQKESKDSVEGVSAKKTASAQSQQPVKAKSAPSRILSLNFKQSFCNLFRWRRQPPTSPDALETISTGENAAPSVVRRALPPLPHSSDSLHHQADADDIAMDFATSIQRVKDYGWYWGPISVEAAEKILSNEPDGSFIVRDSSDDHYIFTLTFKLNGLRHVRIEHDQGNFCFGGCTMFKAPSIVEFIDKAVETSRNGRYLFFLHLRPVVGPVRVQLLYPVSRFKRVQSLQHLCRFQILKFVRRDLINKLPLPRRMLDYLSATHYYSEMLADI